MSKRTAGNSGPAFEVRHSPIHGYGVFALRRISAGTRIVEYLGERVSHEEADQRYEHKMADDNHTFLFTVDERLVIDAGVNGNEARYVNHSCDPNCESVTVRRRIFIDALRTIEAGEELNYDYSIQRDAEDAANIDEVFACFCGASGCRGSMLEPRPKPRRAAVRRPRTTRRPRTAKRKQKRQKG
jgi:SET domain-containing protein